VTTCMNCGKQVPDSVANCSYCEPPRPTATTRRESTSGSNETDSHEKGRVTEMIARYGPMLALAGFFLGLIIRKLMS